ncbi:MAG: hypothetical protein EKK52_01930 [Burkholderiales bacterium]|uniref:DUF6625 family protein n=1 Tax=Roseateles sp. TaxID=1971397 RepID=UPI000F9621A4|nr:MAG: hypothetical protein EKK52_01930 [Burkholderiales bacterium]
MTDQAHASRPPKVAMIVPYFGRRPPYFDVFLKSLERIRHFHWHLLTDCVDLPWPSEQVTVHRSTLAECRRAIEQAAGQAITLDKPYKLCDYRPVYGLAFPELLEGCTHWGYGDLDLLMGDVDRYFERFLELGQEKFLIRGHCSVFPNTPRMLELFRHPTPEVDFGHVAATNEACFFDEWGGMAKIYRAAGISVFNESIMADIYKDRAHLSLTEKQMDYARQAFFWHEGRIRRFFVDGHGQLQDDEFCYIHLQKRSMLEPRWPAETLQAAACIEIRPDRFELVPALTPEAIQSALRANAASALNDLSLIARKARTKVRKWLYA